MDFPANPKEKAGYRLEFFDEFEAGQLDNNKWFPHMLPHWSTLEQSAARYELQDGSLKLLITRDQEPWRENADRASNLQTAHFSGPKGGTLGQFRYDPTFRDTEDLPTLRHHTPQFGYFEIRIKAVPVVGYHDALWMIGVDAPQAGEIRVLEIHGGHIGLEQSRIDSGILRWDDPRLEKECHEDFLPINAAQFHVYAVEWTLTQVDFYVDNRKLRTIKQSPQYPMQFMLGVYERPFEVLEGDRVFPKICEVDYFRSYQPIAGY
jgi:Glycosyl hydrolases family 16